MERGLPRGWLRPLSRVDAARTLGLLCVGLTLRGGPLRDPHALGPCAGPTGGQGS